MELTEILYRGKVRSGSTVAVLPTSYGYEDVGKALRELGAKGIFVDLSDKTLHAISGMFPEFRVVQEDVLRFYEDGIDAVVHFRPMLNYPFEIANIGESVVYIPGFGGLVRNAYRLSSRFVLLSSEEDSAMELYIEGKTACYLTTGDILEKGGFHILEKGDFTHKEMRRYGIYTR
ncbi:MAG: hypothetical protein HYT72_03805 [Candidatus Aenigmarchaeota archaeon]|nr:hypothetical protein [Candidatus Aenigmarchaeota archaeon]